MVIGKAALLMEIAETALPLMSQNSPTLQKAEEILNQSKGVKEMIENPQDLTPKRVMDQVDSLTKLMPESQQRAGQVGQMIPQMIPQAGTAAPRRMNLLGTTTLATPVGMETPMNQGQMTDDEAWELQKQMRPISSSLYQHGGPGMRIAEHVAKKNFVKSQEHSRKMRQMYPEMPSGPGALNRNY